MIKNNILIFISLFSLQLSSQEVLKSYIYSDGYSIIPRSILQFPDEFIIPYSITKNEEKKAGILYLNKDNTINQAILFEGKDDYVINQIIPSSINNNLLISAEGYSEQGQESLYFLEIENQQIVNEFVYNEGGNELDPFAILEIGKNILIGGFIKSRELVSNSFYNMYSETQMIYVAEFTKKGKKIWSKGINLKGYEKGICNRMIMIDDDIVLLCHANKIGEEMSPFLLKIDSKGNVKNIIQIYNKDFITIGSCLRQTESGLELSGSYSISDKHYFYSTLFSSDLELLNNSEYHIPYRLSINGITKDGTIYGSVIKDSDGYNNAIIKLSEDGYSFLEFGNSKSDLLFGISKQINFSYSIGASSENTSTFNIIKNDITLSNFKLLEKVNSKLKIKSKFNIEYESDFIKSTINKGVSKVKIKNVNNNFKSEL